MQADVSPQNQFVEPAEDMGSVLELKNSSKQQNKITAEDTVVHPQANRRTKHQEKVKVRAGVGSAGKDAHHKARQDGTDSVLVQEKSLGNLNRQSRKEKAAKVDELVRHMSNLPGYLQHPERGEKLEEKVLNFGVLDWSRLEKWKHKQKHSPGKGSHNTPLENIAAASISSGLVRPASRPDQQSPRCSSLKSSQKDVLSQGVKPSAQSVVRFQDCEKNGTNGQKKIPFPSRSFGRNHSDIMLDKGKGKSSAQRISSVREAAPGSKSYGVSFGQKEDVSSCDSQAKKTKELQESDIKRKNTDETIISETGSHSSKSQSYDVLLSSKGKAIACDDKTEKSVEELPKLDRNLAHQPCPVEVNDIFLLPPKALPQSGSPKVLQLSKPRASCDVHLAEANMISFSGDFSTSEMDFEEQYSEVSHSCPLPSAGKRLTSSSFDISKTLDQEDAELSTRKGRHPSPNRRFSFSLARLGRSFSFKENAAVPQTSSTYMTVKSGPVRPETSDCSDNPKGEKSSSHNRARSSPLRRLLDPILKHKEANPLHSAEVVKAMKANLNTFVPRPINVSESLQKEKREASSVQALLQLTMKNGLPLFKFLVDRSSNCFVATMKNSSEKDDFGQNFTFYCVNEIKRKVGWMSQGSKSKSCGYAYNVVGQMRVSTSDLSDVNGQNFCKHIIRESVLFGMELRQQANQEAPQFMLNRELAAAVVTIPSKDLSNEEAMEKGCTKCSPEHGLSCNWEDSSIVILPGGVHSSPNKGEPSPLITRWKSGGSCDCGGWDVGCKLRVLSNQNKCRQNSKTTTASPSSDHFELFAEGEAQENKAVFRLEPGKDGTYSIEFNTSISLLQALFICVVIFSSQKPSDMSEAKVSQEAALNGNSGIQVTAPSKYAQNPPHSPVGRV